MNHDLPAELTALSLHLESKATMSDALALDCGMNKEHSRKSQHEKRAQNARYFAQVCRDAAKALTEKKARKKEANLEVCEHPEFIALGALFGRGKRALWSPDELKKYKALKAAGELSTENLKAITTYYLAERRKGEEGRHRRDLSTFLNNFTGELDRARATAPKSAAPQEDPAGWREWLAAKGYSYSAHKYALGWMKDDFGRESSK